MREVSKKALDMLFTLINKNRKEIEVVTCTSFKWNLIKPEHVLQSDLSENQLDQLITLHDCIKLVP